ncbi:MAG: hypothetical protein R3B07_12740 [Polyangiaceae bacterium]
MRLSTPTIFTIAFGILAVTFAGCAATSDNKPLQQDCSAVTTCYDQCICAGGESQACLNSCSANGGSGANGGSANGGTGNTANGGTGNTANGGTGNAANGGTGNTANGGTGNTGNGGSGNTSSCDAAVSFGDQTCGDCALGACCNELTVCFGDSNTTTAPPCAQLVDCMQSFCASAADDAAFQACVEQECSTLITQEAVDGYNGLACLTNSCPTECGG